MSSFHKSNAKYLWRSLLSLGFQPEIATHPGKRGITFGINMFDTPNKDAFYVVCYFLFRKLNPSRVNEVFRHCWPVFDWKTDGEFRKATCNWFRDIRVSNIQAERGSDFPKVVASLFLSPGGPKFINVMLHLAKHVMLQEMKSFSCDGSWIPEASAARAQSLEMAMLRFQLVKMRFTRTAVEQDCLIQEYQRKAQALVKSVRGLRAEDAQFDNLLKHEKGEDEMRLQSEKIVKVRSLWADINNILSTLEEERKVVDCVVKGNIDQYTLDGTDLTVKIPNVLLEQIERSAHSWSAGNMYEAGQLNVLRLLELLNVALCLLREERKQIGGSAPPLDLQHMEEKATLLRRTLEAVKLWRKISKEDIPETKTFIRKMELEWDRKWEDCLKQRPLTSFLNEDPALDFLSPMAPLCFDPATEGGFKSSIFSLYPARLPVASVKEEAPGKKSDSSQSAVLKNADLEDLQSVCHPASQPIETLDQDSVVSSRPSIPCRAPPSKPIMASSRKTLPVGGARSKMTTVQKAAMIMDKECDNLAGLFADTVTASPDCNRPSMELEALLGTISDPFSTRKQIPRTPESLISEVKNSWRRAVEEGEAQKAHLSGGLRNTTSNASKSRPSPDTPHLSRDTASMFTPSLGQAGDSLFSTLSWDSAQLEATQGQSSSDIIHFGIACETIPEMLGSESILSDSDGAPGTSGVAEELENELVLPKILADSLDMETDLRSRLNRIRKDYGEVSFTHCREEALEPPSPMEPGSMPQAVDWEAGSRVFFLDLDSLESPTLSNRERLSLPKLATFSPIDDLMS